MSGDRSFSFVGPDSWIDCQAAPSVLKSLLVTGITVALKVADMAAFMSSVGGMRRFSSMSPPRQIKGMIGQPHPWEHVDITCHKFESREGCFAGVSMLGLQLFLGQGKHQEGDPSLRR